MKKVVILTLIIMFSFSCNSSKPIENPEKYFGTAPTEDIGTGILLFMTFMSNDLQLFSEPSDTSHFATLNLTPKGAKFKPSCFKQFFNPISDTLLVYPSLHFRVLEYDSAWMKIVFDERAQRTCYIKNEYEIYDNGEEEFIFSFFDESFITWENYLLSGEHIRHFKNRKTGERHTQSNGRCRPLIQINLPLEENPPLYDSINGKIIPIKDRCYFYEFHPLEIQDEWLRVKRFPYWKDYEEGWIRWRNGSQILVKVVEEWGID